MIAVLVSTELPERSLWMVSIVSGPLLITTNRSVDLECSMLSLVSHSLHDALQAIAILDVTLVVLVCVVLD